MADRLLPLILLCALACCGLLVSEWRGWRGGRIACKTLASSAFLLVALQAGALDSGYGQLVFAALALCWVGDVLLLAPRGRVFLAGIGAFLLAHVVFALAFAQQPAAPVVLVLAAVLGGAAGWRVLAWLWPHLRGFFRVAVAAYVAAILAMLVFAIGAGVEAGDAWLLAAALAFAASDIAVARNRFVAPGFANRAWGQPLYYAAQLVFAPSVGWVPIAGG